MEGRKRSGRQRLSRDGILASAQQLIDDLGMPGLTMRALAARLDADPSAVYRHFRNKDDLLGALADASLAEMPAPRPPGPGEDWRQAVHAAARDFRATIRDRPGLATILMGSPVTADRTAATAVLLRAMRAAGISAEAAEQGLAAIVAYVFGFAMIEANPPVPGPEPEPGDPVAASAQRVWLAGPGGREHQFTAGLDLILDSLDPASDRPR